MAQRFSYDDVYKVYAWREDNVAKLVLTQGEGLSDSASSFTNTYVKTAKFQLRDDRGIIAIPSDTAATLALKKRDGTEALIEMFTFYTDSEGLTADKNNGIVTFAIKRSMTNVTGEMSGEIRLTTSTGIIKFYGIRFFVCSGVSDSAAEQSEPFSALVAQTNKVEALLENADSFGNLTNLDGTIAQGGTHPATSGVIYDFVTGNFTKYQSISPENINSAFDSQTLYHTSNPYNGTFANIIVVVGTTYATQYRFTSSGLVMYRTLSRSSQSSSWDYSVWGEWKEIVSTSNIQNSAVTTSKIGDSQVTADKLHSDAVTTAKILNANVTPEKLDRTYSEFKSINYSDVDSATTNGIIYKVSLDGRTNYLFCVNSNANLSTQYRFDTQGYVKYRTKSSSNGSWSDWNALVTTQNIQDSAVTESKINTNAVTSEKIANGAVTTAKLAYNSVSNDRLIDGSVTDGKIGVGAVTTNKIGSLAVTEAKISNGAVTENKLANNSVTTAKIKDGEVTPGKLDRQYEQFEGCADADIDNANNANIIYRHTVNNDFKGLVIFTGFNNYNNNGVGVIQYRFCRNGRVEYRIGTTINYTQGQPNAYTWDKAYNENWNPMGSTQNIQDGAVTTSKIGDNQVTPDKLSESYVKESTEIAGINLQSDISAEDLSAALATSISDYAPNIHIGTTDKTSTENGTSTKEYSKADRYINKYNGKMWICTNAKQVSNIGDNHVAIITWQYSWLLKGNIYNYPVTFSYTLPANSWNNKQMILSGQMSAMADGRLKADVDFNQSVYNQLISDGCGGLYVTTDNSGSLPVFTMNAINNVPTVDITVQLTLWHINEW